MGRQTGEADSLAQHVHRAVATLVAADISADAARIDATVLARWCLDWDAATWLTRSIEPPPEGFRSRFDAAIRRRESREPVSHIVGQREFYGRVFKVTPDVLTPRPETELVVDQALSVMDTTRQAGPARAADVGTGSGCLAVTLALEAAKTPWADRGFSVTATDVSPAALGIAAENASRLGAADAIQFARADLLDGAVESYALVVANPPYIASAAAGALAPEVHCEPAAALFAGPDGLDVIRRLIPAAAKALVPGGYLVMEIGHDQDVATTTLVGAERSLELVRIERDLQQLPRVVVARRVERL